MDRPTSVELTAAGLALAALVLAVVVDLIWTVHVLSVVAAYAVALAAALTLSRANRTPGKVDAAVLSFLVFLVVWLPIEFATGPPSVPSGYSRLYVARLAGQWAVPIALTVPIGLPGSIRDRLALLGVHVVALLGLIWMGAVAVGQPLSPGLGATTLLFQHYALAVVVAYPAVLLIQYRKRIDVIFPPSG